MINDLLDYSNFTSSREGISLNIEEFDLNYAIEEVVNLFNY